MKFFAFVTILVSAVASVLGQTIELGYPTSGTVFAPGQSFTAQVILPDSLESCVQVGIALAIASCTNGVCPQPANQLGDVLYAGPFTPTDQPPNGFYQDFNLQISSYMSAGPAIFTLTHLCLLGAGPYPFLEFRTANVTIS